MATTQTFLQPAPQRTGYIGLGLNDVSSLIPQAEVNFILRADTVIEAAAGKDQQLIIRCDLPAGFAYIFQGAQLLCDETEAGDMADWNTDLRSFLQNTTAAAPAQGRWLYPLSFTGGDLVNNSAVLKSRTFIAEAQSKLVIPLFGTVARMDSAFWNVVIDGGALTINFVAKFLEYDLNNAYHWAINTPIPVR